MRAENEMDQRHLFQFQSHQHFFGGEAGSALTTVKLWVGWEKKAATVVVPAVNGLESQVGERPELAAAGNETICQPQQLLSARNCSQIAKIPSWRSGMRKH